MVLRLSERLDLRSVDGRTDLWQVAEDLGLTGLRRLLRRFRVDSTDTRRLVDVQDQGLMDVVYVQPEKAKASASPAGRDDETQPTDDNQQTDECPSRGPIVVRQLWPARPWPAEPSDRPPTVRELEERAASSELPPLHSLASYWGLGTANVPSRPGRRELWLNGRRLSHGQVVREMVRQLNQLPEVDLAYRELVAEDPSPNGAAGDTYAVIQEYLQRAPMGIDARWAWRQSAGGAEEESLVAFADLEQGWIEHGDVTPAAGLVFGDNRHDKGEYRGHHGTAVLGEVLGRHDAAGVGIQGIARAARWVLLSSHYDDQTQESGNVANAIRHLIPRLEPGDVLLLEVQRSYLPTETNKPDLDAIRLAVASGIIVIEAAGNGNANLDHYVDQEGRRVLRRRHPDYRESGALMVAAARAELPHNRLSGRAGVGSNYGSRIDCFAHGDRVVTSGYGDLNGYLEPPDVDIDLAEGRAYSAYFGGTSGAAPIIAGAAMLVQGMHEARTGTRLSPWEMRALLSDPARGTRQGGGVRGRIGVMPDLRRLLREGLELTSNLYVRDNPEDEGRVPVARRMSASPDIVVVDAGGSAPKPLDDDPDCLTELVAGNDYDAFVRVHNRGLQAAEEPEIRVFCSPVATLVTPHVWQEIGSMPLAATAAVTAEARDLPAWAGPLSFSWSAAAVERLPLIAGTQDGGQRFCFTATVRDGRDHEMAPPPGEWPYFDWRQFRAFMRWRNGVACRSVHDAPAGDGELTLPFLVTGSPNRPLSFDLEIVRGLASATPVDLVAHAALASRLRRSRLWPAEALAQSPEAVRLTLPRRPRQLIRSVRLVAGARFPCSLVVGAGRAAGNTLAVRQLYRGREVGRITWRFRS